jgi:hypothetical protein
MIGNHHQPKGCALMPIIRLKHLNVFKDRYGQRRTYLRIPGMRATPLPGKPGSPEFMAAYNSAVAAAVPKAKTDGQVIPGSLDALAMAYYDSPAFNSLRESTRAAYRRIVEELRAGHGSRPVHRLEPRHVEMLMAQKAEHPTAANHRLRLLRALMAHAVKIRMIPTDPCLGIRKVDLSRVHAALIAHLGCLAFESQGTFASQR